MKDPGHKTVEAEEGLKQTIMHYDIGERVEVRSPASGYVEWDKADSAEVRPDEEYLGVVRDEDDYKKTTGIRNPIFGEVVKGVLILVPRFQEQSVDTGARLADIRITGLVYAEI